MDSKHSPHRAIFETCSDKSRAEWRERWTNKLQEIAQRPLSCCSEFPRIAARWTNWWNFASRSPLLVCAVPKRSDVYWGKAFHLLHKPAEWLKVKNDQLQNTHWAGDTVPCIRVDIGPAPFAAFLGSPIEFDYGTDTSWLSPARFSYQDSLIDRWQQDNSMLRLVLELLELTSDAARGNFLVCLPDLSGPIDILSRLVGTEQLCTDLFDREDHVRKASLQLVQFWEMVFTEMYNTVLSGGAGLTQWGNCWCSDSSYSMATCDFNTLISPSAFERICMPSIDLQAQRSGKCILHLDGPEALRHVEVVSRTSSITAVEFTPGARAPSAIAHVEKLKLLQSFQKPLLVVCPSSEVEALIDCLDPRGLALWPEGVLNPQMADQLQSMIDRRFPAVSA